MRFSVAIDSYFNVIHCITMAKPELPTRYHCSGPTELVALRVHSKLLKVVRKIAEEKGWSFTDVALLALDGYAAEMKPPKKKRGSSND